MTNTVTVTEQNNTVSILEDAPIVTAEPWYQDFTTIPTSSGSATVTADAAAHTKGAWVEIIASNAADTSALFLDLTSFFTSSTDTATLLDIGIGASGSESAILSNIAVGGAAAVIQLLPIGIPSGSRISARIQSVVTGGKTGVVALSTFAYGDTSTVPTSLDVLGTSTGTSEGTNVTTSYTEVIASTSQAYKAVAIVESLSATSSLGTTYTLSVGVGASGSETLIHTKKVSSSTAELVTSVADNPIWFSAVDIPAGSRLAATISAFNLDVTIIGIPA